MNKKQKIIQLIRDYQQAMQEGVKCLNSKQADHPFFYQETDENGFLKRNGYIENEKKTYYEFHGPCGCLIKWEDGRFVDFDLGEDGRCDGFDPGFIATFYDRNIGVKEKFQSIVANDIEEIIDELKGEGLIIYNELDRLCYFKEDYHNLTPFKWVGGHV